MPPFGSVQKLYTQSIAQAMQATDDSLVKAFELGSKKCKCVKSNRHCEKRFEIPSSLPHLPGSETQGQKASRYG